MVGKLIVLGTALVALAGAAPAEAAQPRPACPTAVPAQSMQVRAAWGTPCVRFAAGGWKLYLKGGGAEPHGEHDFYGRPYALVWTSGATAEGWSRGFSHEVIEMLEDPTLDVRYMR